jgi:alpha-N-arabinofuranosidase
MKVGEYAETARKWAHGLRLVDPTITLVSCGREGNGAWDATALETLAPFVDMHSIHFYSTLGQEKVPEVEGLGYENNVFGPAVRARRSCFC